MSELPYPFHPQTGTDAGARSLWVGPWVVVRSVVTAWNGPTEDDRTRRQTRIEDAWWDSPMLFQGEARP